MNRETKRMLQRQGELGPDGTPVAATRPTSQRSSATRPVKRISIVDWYRSVAAELRKVAWPSREEVKRYSLVVLLALVVLITLIFVLDSGFSRAAAFLFKVK